MPRAKRHAQTTCADCDRPFYAKGLCKPCYMALNRAKFRVPSEETIAREEIDPEDFWQFVKKELNIV